MAIFAAFGRIEVFSASVQDVVHHVLISEWLSFIHRLQEKRNRHRAECVAIGGSVTYISL